jgi:phage protein D
MSAQPAVLAAGVLRIDGVELPPELAALLVLLRVRESVRLPDQAYLRIADTQLTHVDEELLSVGRALEVLYAPPGGRAPTSVFSGRIESIELDLLPAGAVLAATAYEPAFVLHQRRRTQVFQDVTSGDIAEQLIGDAGLHAAVTTTPDCEIVHPFVLQSEESDWQLLWRLADAIGYEVVGEGKLVRFAPAGTSAPGSPLVLSAPQQLISFRPRITAAQQIDGVEVRGWDPGSAEAIVAEESPTSPESTPGIARADVAAVSEAGTWTVGDRTVLSQGEASALAASLAARLANSWAEAEGVAIGDPRLRAGCKVQIEGVGSRFGGVYAVSAATHVLVGGRGYETQFASSGRSGRTLAELIQAAPSTPQWSTSVVVGVVTQTDDPEGLGRVRVQYPALGDDAEGWWARVAAPAAGSGRGLLMMPLAGDEVVLAFEQGDPRRPYVLGAVWNGRAKPGELVHSDGSFALASDQAVSVSATGAITLAATKGASVDAKQQLELKGGTSITVAAGETITIEGARIVLKGDDVAVQASGAVRIAAAEVLFQ